jgi:hypothetical protein
MCESTNEKGGVEPRLPQAAHAVHGRQYIRDLPGWDFSDLPKRDRTGSIRPVAAIVPRNPRLRPFSLRR